MRSSLSLLFSSVSPIRFSLGAKSIATPFSGAAMQLISLQKEHLSLILGEKKRTRDDEMEKKFSSSSNQKEPSSSTTSAATKSIAHELKSTKKFRQEEELLKRLQKEQDVKYFGEGGLEGGEDDEYDHNFTQNQQQQQQQQDDLMNEIEVLERQQEVQEQAEEIKNEFLEKLEELRPMFFATKALESNRMYSAPLLKALKYFKLQDDPLYEQLAAALGRLDVHGRTRKMNGLLIFGENSEQQQKMIKKKKGQRNKSELDYDPEEDEDIYTNSGDLSGIHHRSEEFASKMKKTPISKKPKLLFKTMDRQMEEQKEERKRLGLSEFEDDEEFSDYADLRTEALLRLRSNRLPTEMSMNTPQEYPAPQEDDIAEASSGASVRRDLGIRKVPYAHRGHWVLREKGIAASGDTRKMDPW